MDEAFAGNTAFSDGNLANLVVKWIKGAGGNGIFLLKVFMLVLTDQNFEKEVLRSNLPVLVDFLTSDEADHITGTVLYVDGGWLAG